MKPRTYDTTHPLYPRAVAHALNVLKLPEEEIKAKVKERSAWTAESLPTLEELAILILKWSDEQDALRGIK